jgi:hypothetical protein
MLRSATTPSNFSLGGPMDIDPLFSPPRPAAKRKSDPTSDSSLEIVDPPPVKASTKRARRQTMVVAPGETPAPTPATAKPKGKGKARVSSEDEDYQAPPSPIDKPQVKKKGRATVESDDALDPVVTKGRLYFILSNFG